MKTFKLFNFNRRNAMVQAEGCTAARQKIGVNPTGTPTFARFASSLCLILTMLLTLGIGQMWADSGAIYGAWINYSYSGTTGGINLEETTSSDLGTLSADFVIDDVYLKCWDDWGDNKKWSGGQIAYTLDNWSSTTYLNPGTWSSSSKDGSNYQLEKTSYNQTISNISGASGSYTMKFYCQVWGNNVGDSYLNNSGSNYTFSWKVAPPAVSDFTITPSGEGYVSGTGTSEDPYIIHHSSGNLTLTISGSQAHTDANSVAEYSTDGGSTWSTYTDYITINRAFASTTAKSKTLKMRYNNSTARLTGAESSFTAYYKIEAGYTLTHWGSTTGGSYTVPSSAGAVSGGTVSASPSTGYNFGSWSVTSGSGTWENSTSTASNTFYPTSNSTLKATFTAKNYTVTLDKNDGDSNGSIQTTYNSSSTSSFSGASRAGYSCNGYFTATSGGSKIINADGTLVNETVSGWLSSGKWVKNAATITLYAQWTENASSYTVNYGVKSDQTSLGSLSCATTTGSTAVASGGEVVGGTNVTFTASPIAGYEVDAWYSDAACTSRIAAAGYYTSTFSPTINSDTTVYVTFKKKVYTITYSPSSAPTGFTYNTKPTSGTYGNTVTMVITPSTGYSVSVSAVDASSNTVTISNPSTNTYTFTQPASAVTVTVSTSQIMSTLSTSCSYDAGNPSYSAPSKSVSSIGIATTSNVTATAAGTGYTFVGWTLTHCVRTDENAEDSRSITVRSDGSGEAASAVANYEEDLTSRWHLVGQDVDSKVTYPSGWSVNSTSMMQKATGYSTESVVYANVTVSNASGTYEFKVVDDNGASDDIWYGYSNGSTYLTWTATATKTVYAKDDGGENNNSNNLKFTPTVAGTYVFKVDYSGSNPAVTITYPTSYTLTYDIGTVKGTDGSISTSPSTASGSKVLSGNSVTLTAPAAKTGYSWKGWYTNAAGTTGKIDDVSRAITVTMNANKTLYACYTENSYTVTVNASSGGKVSYNGGDAGSSCSASAGVATKSATISAIPNTGYAFVGWTNVDADHHITDFTATWNSTNKGWDLVVNADDATTITANFAPRFALVGSVNAGGNPTGGMPGWGDGDEVAFTYSAGTYTLSRTLTTPNTGYKFKIIDRLAEEWIWRGHTSSSNNLAVDNTTTYTLSGTNDVYFDSRGVGSYTFTVVEETVTGVVYPKVKIQDGANSHVVTWGYVSDNGQEGGTITSVVDGEATPNSIASGKYVKDGGSITVTAAAVTPGYRFIDFRTSSTYGGGSQLSTSNPYTVASVKADQNIYAQFAENLCTVTITANNKSAGSITVGGEAFAWDGTTNVGVYNYKSLVVTPAAGYYFSGWTLSSTPDFTVGETGESGSSTDLYGRGGTHGSTGTLTANFTELEKIFFRNENEATGEKLWDVDSMYVYFNVDWGKSGASENGVTTSAGKFAKMKPVSADSKIFWAYIPRTITKADYTKIAFSDVWMGSSAYPGGLYGEFWENKGAYRTDYIKYLNMYVPASKKSTTSNSTDYYSNGYWMKYDTQTDQGASYYLKENTGSGELSEFKVAASNGNAIYTTYRFENTDAKTFYISNAAGQFYKATSAISSTDCTDVEMGEGNTGFTVTPTFEGYYTFTIDQSGDTMKISVNYPVSAGDYQLVYTYASGSKTHTSDIIKFESTIQTTKKSVYIDPTGGVSLKLQKCTGIDGETKQPTWTTGVSVGTLSSIFTQGKGVYVFNVNIDNTGKAANADASVSLSNVALYDGQYYIKTDYAPGGWVNYKRNILTQNTINFSKSDSKTFDYYHCAWVGDGGKNVKCIIANDYNQQITDTLIGDEVLGLLDDGVTPRQYLATSANVRFSYNSYTNELKRAYINGSSDHHDYYLYLEGTKVDANLSTDGTQTSNSLSDRNNWTYMLNIQAQPTARVRLTAKYGDVSTGYVQSFIGDKDGALSTSNTVEIMGGEGSDWSNLRVVYDFKTNNLMTAWLVPGGTIESDKEIFADVMIIRKDQGDAEQITFGGSAKKLDEVGLVYSTMQFTYNHLANKKANGSDSTLVSSEREFYWISFPHDVLISDIFGSVGSFYNEWGILYYDGKERAKEGNWADTKGFWKYFTNPNDTLKAFEGYVLVIDYPLVGTVADEGKWINGVRDLYLYFPSLNDIGNIHKGDTTININQTGYKCEIDRRTDKTTPDINKDRRIADSYWHLIGVPSFKDASHTTGTSWTDTDSDTKVDMPDISDWSSTSVPFVYEWDKKKDEYTPVTTSSFTFKAMYSYMVQYSGSTISWTAVSAPKPVSVAPRRSPEEENGAYEWRLSLLNGEEEQDRTFIRMTNEENVTAGFEFNYDLCKEINKNKANIYTFADYVPVAGNVLPTNNQTTVIPVGVKIATNDDYTFSIPEGTEGIGVTLIDKETGIRTNLSALDYTVSLEAGNNDNRFVLEISPIYNTPTEIEQSGISNQQSTVKKVLIDGLLYIVRDGKIFDARGVRVE